MNVRDMMCDEVFTCRATESLECAARLMREHDCGSVPVVDEDNHVIGLVTDRDICMAACTQGLRLADIPVRTAMSQQIHVCSVHDEHETVERIMQEQRVRRVPVVDDERRLVGIVSLNDIALVAMDGFGTSNAPLLAIEVAMTLGNVCRPHVARAVRASDASREDGRSHLSAAEAHGEGAGEPAESPRRAGRKPASRA